MAIALAKLVTFSRYPQFGIKGKISWRVLFLGRFVMPNGWNNQLFFPSVIRALSAKKSRQAL